MRVRSFRWVLVLYPRAWRDRYGEEVSDLCAELLAVGELTRLHLALGLAKSALAERVRSVKRGRFITGAALVLVAVVALLATNTFGLAGSTSPRVTPVGWDSFAYREAQVSFPPWFQIITGGPGGVTQVSIVGSSPASGGTCLGPVGGTLVCLLPVGKVPTAYAREKPTAINGIPVYLGQSGDYYAPSLGAKVTASGPLAHRIVDTLTRSPWPSCEPPRCSVQSAIISGVNLAETP